MSARLAQAHRIAQARLGAQTMLRMRSIWPLLDNENVDATFDSWLTAAVPIVAGQRMASSRLAANYLTASKVSALGVGAAPLRPVLADHVEHRGLTTSLLVTGPLSLKRAAARGVRSRTANDVAETSSAAAAMRYALDGGRDTIIQTLRSDRNAVGYERVTSGNACAFCEDLAGIRMTDDDAFQAHDGCGCAAAPVWN